MFRFRSAAYKANDALTQGLLVRRVSLFIRSLLAKTNDRAHLTSTTLDPTVLGGGDKPTITPFLGQICGEQVHLTAPCILKVLQGANPLPLPLLVHNLFRHLLWEVSVCPLVGQPEV